MKIGFIVNSLDVMESIDTLLDLALVATKRGHKVWFIGIDDLTYDIDGKTEARGCCVKGNGHNSTENYLKDLINIINGGLSKVTFEDLDIILLRNDPSIEPSERSWARSIALDFGRLAVRQGVVVLNSPEGLSNASNKMYFQHFPEEVRPKTIITRNKDKLKEFITEFKKVVMKPLSGSGGKNVFLASLKDIPNINQMIDAISRDGYVIAQEYLPEAENGDIRLFLMNGEPLEKDGKYCAFRRVKVDGDLRNNVNVGGKTKKAKIDDKILKMCKIIKPKLVRDGMFLVGLDIVGDKLLEVNVFCPGGIDKAEKYEGINFAELIMDEMEQKVESAKYYKDDFDNKEIATL
jgi:glutathione synthase